MDWLNYHHLYYFYVVAKEGKISLACQKLHLSQPTVSAQVRAFEDHLGVKLLARSGRGLVLTETGRVVYKYAEEIFALGNELTMTLKGRPTGRPARFKVGITGALPKLVAYRLIEPAIRLPEPVFTTCIEGMLEELLTKLSTHELDLVLSDSPIQPNVRIRAFNHLLGECDVSVFGVHKLALRYRKNFPRSLDGAPFLLPTENTTLRRSLDHWFDTEGIHPHVVNEFEDSALLKVFGQDGQGLFAMPSIIEKEVQDQYGVKRIGRLVDLRERFYAISLERKIKHPSVEAITRASHDNIFLP